MRWPLSGSLPSSQRSRKLRPIGAASHSADHVSGLSLVDRANAFGSMACQGRTHSHPSTRPSLDGSHKPIPNPCTTTDHFVLLESESAQPCSLNRCLRLATTLDASRHQIVAAWGGNGSVRHHHLSVSPARFKSSCSSNRPFCRFKDQLSKKSALDNPKHSGVSLKSRASANFRRK